MKNKKVIIPVVVIVVLLIVASVAYAVLNKKSGGAPSEATPVPTPRAKVNLIDINDRPYITLQPLASRNELELTIHNLPKKADDIEILLEYDRNKGIPDAVLKNFSLDKIPYTNKLFMGSKSSGGHTTYHDDVTGGSMTITFSGDQDYALQVPWRYDDTQPHYTQLATSDLKFQLLLDKPFRTPKVVVMESSGLPAKTDGKVIAGPYLVRGVGPLPEIQAKLTIHTSEEATSPQLLGFDGQKWQKFDITVDGRTITSTVPLLDAYVVVQ